MLGRVYLGYHLLGMLAKVRGDKWANERRHRHHRWSSGRFYETAVRNQGLLIKTAQFLSSRPDVLPDEYVEVLSGLQDEVPAEPYSSIRRVVERELRQPLGAVFAEFAAEPVAAASLAQVHRATLKDGRAVAVKVQYPDIERLVAIDLKNIARFVSLLNRIDRSLDFSFLTEEMSRAIPLELDFINEGRNAEAIAADFAAAEDVIVPRICWDYTTRRVLTMEFLDGVKVTDIEGIRRLGVDPADVAKIIAVAFSEMILDHGRFHADPHPGNLMVASGPRLILVDFGQVKEVGPQFRAIFAQMTRALIAADDAATGRSFRNLGFRMKRDTDAGYEQLGAAYVGNIAKRLQATETAWADRDMFRESYRDLLRLLRANPLITVPPDLLFVGRVMGLLNGLNRTLGSRTNLLIEMARLLDRPASDREALDSAGRKRRLLEA